MDTDSAQFPTDQYAVERRRRKKAREEGGQYLKRLPGNLRFEVPIANRWSVETFFNCCFACQAVPRQNCTCHDEGKGTD
jgi:hypothetical protein